MRFFSVWDRDQRELRIACDTVWFPTETTTPILRFYNVEGIDRTILTVMINADAWVRCVEYPERWVD
jgi:hypothetical protein